MLRALCWCCLGSSNDDDRRLLVDDAHSGSNNAAVTTVRRRSYNSATEDGPGRDLGGYQNGRAPVNALHPAVGRSVEDEETAMLNRILEQTQANIIEVSAVDGLAVGADFAARASKYDELLKRRERDHRGWSTVHPASTSAGSKGAFPKSNEPTYLLNDAGNHVSDYLGRESLSAAALANVRRMADDAQHAVLEGIRVEHKENLVVHMTLSS